MGTQKSVGTITYNTPDYLMKVLNGLVNDRWIDDYRAIYHYGEGDNSATGLPRKDHYHVMVFPAKRIELYELQDRFLEPVINSPEPLAAKPFRYSEPLNWIMYVLHDPDYLKSHAKTSDGDGKIQYTPIEIVSYDRDLLHQDYMRALHIRQNTNQKVMELAVKGNSFYQILSMVPEVNPLALKAIMSGLREDLTYPIKEIPPQSVSND